MTHGDVMRFRVLVLLVVAGPAWIGSRAVFGADVGTFVLWVCILGFAFQVAADE